MSDSDRGKRSKDLIAAGLGALALFATVILAFAIGTTLGVNSGRDQATAREHYENTKQDNLRACIGREGPAAIECVTEAIETAQEQSDSRQDLYAQRDMSRWAFWLLILTGVTVAITAVGVWFVKRTLDATLEAVEDTGKATGAMLEANRIAKAGQIAQLRPYVVITAAFVEPDEIADPEIVLSIANYGKLPARVSLKESYIPADKPALWPEALAKHPKRLDDVFLHGEDQFILCAGEEREIQRYKVVGYTLFDSEWRRSQHNRFIRGEIFAWISAIARYEEAVAPKGTYHTAICMWADIIGLMKTYHEGNWQT